MPNLSKQLTGTRSSTGVISMDNNPDFGGGRYASGPIFVGTTPLKSADIQIETTATVTIQVNNGDPTSASDWTSVTAVSSSAVWTDNFNYTHIRFNVTSWAAGSVVVNFSAMG